jgi:hypothetical protein
VNDDGRIVMEVNDCGRIVTFTCIDSLFLESVPPRGGQQFIFSIQSNNQSPLEVAAENVEVCLITINI